MKKIMKLWAEKKMMMAHQAVERYQEAMKQNKDMPLNKKNMLYGLYLIDTNETL